MSKNISLVGKLLATIGTERSLPNVSDVFLGPGHELMKAKCWSVKHEGEHRVIT